MTTTDREDPTPGEIVAALEGAGALPASATSVYVANLAAYNAGRLVGEWVDAADLDALDAATRRASRNGEGDWAIHDYDGSPAWVRIAGMLGEYPGQTRLHEIAETLDGLDGDEPDVFAAWVSYDPTRIDPDADLDETLDDMRSAILGIGPSVESVVESWWHDINADALAGRGDEDPLVVLVEHYVDWEAYWDGTLDPAGAWYESLPSGDVVVFDR